jgi:hypothetical protein
MIINFDPPSTVEVYIERRGQSGHGVIRGPNGLRETIHVVSLVPYGVAGSGLMRELRAFRCKEQLLMPPPRVDPTPSTVCSITDVITHCARAASLVSDVRTEVCHAFSPHTSRWLAQAPATTAAINAASTAATNAAADYEDMSYSQGDDSSTYKLEEARRSSEEVEVNVQYAELSPHSWYKRDVMDDTAASVDSHPAVSMERERERDRDRDIERERERERESSKRRSSYSSSSSSSTSSSSTHHRYHPSSSSTSHPSHPSSSSSSHPSSSTTNHTGSNAAKMEKIGGIPLPEDLKSPAPVHPVTQHYSTPSGFTVDLNSANAVLSQVKNAYLPLSLFLSCFLSFFLTLTVCLSLSFSLSLSLSLSLFASHLRFQLSGFRAM